MEKHNTHIILDSNESSKHDYEKDENGNIKIDANEDIPYRSFIEKKKKISIKSILIDNNNIFKEDYNKNVLSEEMYHKIKKKKKKKISTEDLYIKAEEYRFNESKIKPCFNEVELKYPTNKEIDKKNLSYEIKEKNKKSGEDISEDKNNKIRKTMHLMDYKTNSNRKIIINSNKTEGKKNNESQNKETKTSRISDYSELIVDNKNNKSKQKKEKEEIINSERSSKIMLLKDKIQYKENESYNKDKNNRHNKKEEVKISKESIPEDIKGKNVSKSNNINTDASKEKFLYENNTKKTNYNISQDTSNDKFLKDQKTPQKIKKKEDNKIYDKNQIIDTKPKEEHIDNENANNKIDNNIIKQDDINVIKLLREILSYDENELYNNIIKEKNQEKKEHLNEDQENNDKKNNKNEIQNESENINDSHLNNPSENNNSKIKEVNKSQVINTTNVIYNPKEEIDSNKSINSKKERKKEENPQNKSLTKEKKDDLKVENNDNFNQGINDQNNENNTNLFSNSGNYSPNKRPNSSSNLNNKNKNEDFIEKQKQVKRNTIDALHFPKNIYPSLQNMNNFKNKNEQLENGDNLHMLLDKIQDSDNSYDINKNQFNENGINDSKDKNNLKSNGKKEYKNIEDNSKNFNEFNLSNGQQNIKDSKNKYNNYNKIKEHNNNEFKDYNHSNNNKIYNNSSQNEKEELDKFLNNKNNEENIKQEDNKRLTTEEYLENNLESLTVNKEKSRNEGQKGKEKSETNKNTKNKSIENSEYITSHDVEKEEIIIIRQIMPICYINKKRQKELKINKVIPRKKRVFISKLVNPHDLNDMNETEEISLPIIPLCFMTNKYIVQKAKQIMNTVNNRYFFHTKIGIKREEEEERKKLKILSINKIPKVYKKAIVSPNKNSLFRTKTKGGKMYKSNSLIDVNNSNNNPETNFHKGKKRKEKISLISKDRDPNEDSNSTTKNKNIIIKENDKTIKELSSNLDGNNHIDISIQFSNKVPLGFLNNKNPPTKKLKKYPVSAKKKHKNLAEKLFKDLKEINNKLINKDEYLKKNFLDLHYDRHVGDEKTCPICKQVRKRGRKLEREKGLFNAFSFRNFKNISKKSFSKLKITLQQKGKEKDNDLWNNYDKRNNLENNFFSLNNNKIDTELRQKYMQFNGMNRQNKLNRYGSYENLSNLKQDSDKKNFRNLHLNMDKEMEKNGDELDKLQYPALKNYFYD